MPEMLVDNESVLRQLRGLIDAGTGSADADIAAYVIAGWLDAGSLALLAEAKGGAFIEDKKRAVERMARFEFERSPWQNSAKVTWETATEGERQKYQTWAAPLLAAAEGRET